MLISLLSQKLSVAPLLALVLLLTISEAMHSSRVATRVLRPRSHVAMSSSASSVDGMLDKAIFLQGQVTHGYGRGSKKLGVPTANLPHFDKELRNDGIKQGVYYGWSALHGHGSGQLIPCVANIGKSPTFEGEENPVNIVEVHLIEPPTPSTGDSIADGDFYGTFMRVALVGYLRPETKFASFDALVTQINQDVKDAASKCASPPLTALAAARRFLDSDFESDPMDVRSVMSMVKPSDHGSKSKNDNALLNLKTLWGLSPLP
jgi:riboflavin kinase